MGRYSLVVLCLATGVAVAQSTPEAQQAFQRGRAALQTGDYEQACKAFEESYELEPAGETRFNIALCSEQLGKLATALQLYQELARTETGSRRTRSVQSAESLVKRVPRLRIELGNKDKVVPAGFIVTLDGVRVTNFKDSPIDIGTHTVMAAASGHQNWQGVAEASWEREVVIVSITLVPGKPGPDILTLTPPPPKLRKPKPKPKPEEVVVVPVKPPPPVSTVRRTVGKVITAGGGAVLAGGLVAGFLARSKYAAAKDECGGTECSDPDAFARASKLVDDARMRGNLSTALVIGGGALAMTGLVLWLTAPTDDERAVAIAPSANGISVVGRF